MSLTRRARDKLSVAFNCLFDGNYSKPSLTVSDI